jgi:hypothetical protein
MWYIHSLANDASSLTRHLSQDAFMDAVSNPQAVDDRKGAVSVIQYLVWVL